MVFIVYVSFPPIRWGSDCLRVPSVMERTMGIRFFFFSFWWWCLFSSASRTFTLTLSSSSLDASWWSSTMSATHQQRPEGLSRKEAQSLSQIFLFYRVSVHFPLLFPEHTQHTHACTNSQASAPGFILACVNVCQHNQPYK